MKRRALLIFSLLFMLSATLAVYSNCAQAADDHFHFSSESHDPAIHCTDPLVNSSTLAPSAYRPEGKKVSKVLVALHPKVDRPVSAPPLTDYHFGELSSQQDLFRLEEVYRI